MKKSKVRRLRIGCLALVLSAGMLYFCGDWLRFQVSALWYDHHSFDTLIRQAARKHGLDSRLVKAVVYQESRFNPSAVGAAGEVGLMQLMPNLSVVDWANANRVPVPSRGSLFSPELNLEIGCWYLARGFNLYREYDGAAELALCYFNAGPSRAVQWKPEEAAGDVCANIDIKSTRRYVEEIMERYRYYMEHNPFREER